MIQTSTDVALYNIQCLLNKLQSITINDLNKKKENKLFKITLLYGDLNKKLLKYEQTFNMIICSVIHSNYIKQNMNNLLLTLTMKEKEKCFIIVETCKYMVEAKNDSKLLYQQNMIKLMANLKWICSNLNDEHSLKSYLIFRS